MDTFWNWLNNLEWNRLIPELLGKGIGFFVGFLVSWLLVFRRSFRELSRFQKGESDDFMFQMHALWPIPDSDDAVVLLFRNIVPKTTLDDLYDNAAARKLVKNLASRTSLANPVLQTEGTKGFEVLNDAVGHVSGHLATSPFDREVWLFTMTREDEKLVRKKCIRCFLIRPEDLERFQDWNWCHNNVWVEKPWHWFRVAALHQIAKIWHEEKQLTRQDEAQARDRSHDMPLVDKQLRHNRVRELSLGVNSEERPVVEPYKIEWEALLPQLKELGLDLDTSGEDEVRGRQGEKETE